MSLLPLIERRAPVAQNGSHTRVVIIRPRAASLLLLLVAALLFVGSFMLRQHSGLQPLAGGWGSVAAGSGGRRPVDTLVIYVYSDSDPEYRRNLEFLVTFGMAEGDGCEYIIVVQQDEEGQHTLASLPSLPPNARYRFHPNECFDWGTIGWVLETVRADTHRYKWFMFLNSSTRGPFLPAYWPAGVHWSRAFTGRITADVKLVGATISCENTLRDGDPTKGSRQSPHVQSYAMATDQAGLAVLQADGKVFECHKTIDHTVWHSELGASMAILQAGFNLDSLMVRYQGIDWRDPAFRSCNAEGNPYKEASLDGTTLAPTEVLFVKVKGFLRDLGWTSAVMAERHDAWLRHKGNSTEVTSNRYLSQLPALKKKRAFEMATRGIKCFDGAYYRKRNSDLPPMGKTQRWTHFMMYGQFEGRPFRFSCTSDGAAPQATGATRSTVGNHENAEAASSEVTPEEMRAAALEAARTFEVMAPHAGGLLGAVREFQELGPERSWQKAARRRQKAEAQAQQHAQQLLQPGRRRATGMPPLRLTTLNHMKQGKEEQKPTDGEPQDAAQKPPATEQPRRRAMQRSLPAASNTLGAQRPLNDAEARSADHVGGQTSGGGGSGSSDGAGAALATGSTAADQGAEAAAEVGPAPEDGASHGVGNSQRGTPLAAPTGGNKATASAVSSAQPADSSLHHGISGAQQGTPAAIVVDQASGAEAIDEAPSVNSSMQAHIAVASPVPDAGQPASSAAESLPQQTKRAASSRKPGSSKRKRQKVAPHKVQHLSETALTLFGSDPHLRIVNGNMPDLDA